MRPIHFVKIMAFARDNNLVSKSFNDVVSVIRNSAKARGMEFEKYLEQYQ